MRIIYYEAKKMFYHQRGLMFILLLFIGMLVSLLLTERPFHSDEELYQEEYFYYLNQLKGICTEEKKEYLENEAQRIAGAEVELQRLYIDYYDGKYTEPAFQAKMENTKKILQHKNGFEVIYNQYLYIRENPENRFFMDRNGWSGLMGGASPNLFLMFAVLLLITPAFCYEYESKMELLVLTTQNGEKSYYAYKYGFGLITVALLSFCSVLVRYFYYLTKYGLENGNYPIQSLPEYAGTSKQISIWTAFVEMSALTVFGFLFFSVCIMFLSIMVKKYAITVFFSAASFREISSNTMLLLICISFALCIFMSYYIYRKNKNRWSGTGKPILLLCIVTLFMSGCSQKEQSECLFNSTERMQYETEQYRFFVDDGEDSKILAVENNETGKTERLVRNPVNMLTREERLIFGRDSCVYYIVYDLDRSAIHGEDVSKMSVIELDTTNFNEKVIFEKNISRNQDYFLGLKPTESLDWQFLFGSSALFLNDRYLYFAGNDLRQIDRITGKASVLDVPVNRCFAFDGKDIYYINDKLVLAKYDTLNGTYEEITDIVTSYFVLTEDKIFYVNRMGNGILYSADKDGTKCQKVTEVPVNSFECRDGYLYFENSLGNQRSSIAISDK